MPSPEIRNDLTVEPYNDTTNYELSKGYVRPLMKQGLPPQNRELNVMTGLLYGQMKKITDILIDDGSIVSDCNFLTDYENEMCTLSSGQVYINGSICNVEETKWSFSQVPEGIAYVCLEFNQVVYTVKEDSSLYDPAQNFENSGSVGADRLAYQLTPFIATDTEFNQIRESNSSYDVIKLIKIKDRVIVSPVKPSPYYGRITDYLAQRFYDSDGNYIASGLRVSTEVNKNNPLELYTIRVSSGRAYVLGYQYSFPMDILIENRAAIDTDNNYTSSLADEVIAFNTVNDLYFLSHKNAKSIRQITAIVQATNIPVVRNNSTYTDTINTDYIVNQGYQVTNIYDITKVYDDNRTYEKGKDYGIQNNAIVWTADSASLVQNPYKVDLQYTTVLTNKDYVFGSNVLGSYIQFLVGGRTPINNYSVRYEWYLSRVDLVYMNLDGEIVVKNGLSKDVKPIAPDVPLSCLPIALIAVDPSITPDKYEIQSYNIYRVPVSTLRQMKTDIEDLQYNVSMLALEKQSENSFNSLNDGSLLSNIFVDSVSDYRQIDTNNVLYNCNYDVLNHEITLPLECKKYNGITDIMITDKDEVNAFPNPESNSLGFINIRENVLAAWQPYASSTMDIAPHYYTAYDVKLIASIKCSPKVSTYMDSTTDDYAEVWIPQRVAGYTTSNVVSESGKTDLGTTWNGNTATVVTGNRLVSEEVIETVTYEVIGTETVEKDKVINDLDIATYIDPNLVIYVTGTNFKCYDESARPIIREVRIMLEGTQVYSTIATEDGSETKGKDCTMDSSISNGCIMPDDDGNFTACFKVPAGTLTGYKEVTVDNKLPDTNRYYQSTTDSFTATSFSKSYTDVATKRNVVIQHTTYTTVRVYAPISYTYTSDPLAQSFKFDADTYITALDLFFESVREDAGQAFLNIMEVANGYPSQEILYSQELVVDDIRNAVSIDGSTAFNIQFTKPIFCEANKEYAFSIGSNKDGIRLWYAKMGELRADGNNEEFNYQPYSAGVMFTSSNNSTWSAIQDSDIKFNIYRAEFESSKAFYIAEAVPQDADKVMEYFSLMTPYFLTSLPEGTNIEYKYNINISNNLTNSSDNTVYTNTNWLQLQNQAKHIIDFDDSYLSNGMHLAMRIDLTTENTRISPIIDFSKFELFIARYKDSGTYVQYDFDVD